MKKFFYIIIGFTIISTYACTKPLDACFNNQSGVLTTNIAITFDASCSQNATQYKWIFGDNSSDSITSSPVITHKYSSSGSYMVTLGVKRDNGKTLGKDKAVFQKTITIQ